jgi:hypothetical protein
MYIYVEQQRECEEKKPFLLLFLPLLSAVVYEIATIFCTFYIVYAFSAK